MEEDDRTKRLPLKTQQFNWKQKLRDNCFKRIRADRNRLLWKMRAPSSTAHASSLVTTTHKEIMDFTFRNIVSDELKKIKGSSGSVSVGNDIWEYDGLQKNSQSSESECEEILIEMQRIFYEDLRVEEIKREQANYVEPWDEEDDYLAEAARKQLHLDSEEVCEKEVWCPMCKQGDLREDYHLISCTRCEFQLSRGDEVNLEILRAQLADAHTDHLDRGCRLAPNFCMETRFNLTALYIQCEACDTFEIVL